MAVLAVAGYFAYSALQRVTPFLTVAGCQAGSGTAPSRSIRSRRHRRHDRRCRGARAAAGARRHDRLRDGDAGIHTANLDYGDLDSVGVFQQRPSEGWGTTSELEDPAYATARFFGALTQVHGYLQLPVDQAAQAVQHSADGSAYAQYDLMAPS